VVLVEFAYSIAVETFLFDLEIRSHKQFWRQLLDREPDGVSSLGKSPVSHRPVALAAGRGKQLRRSAVVEAAICRHIRSNCRRARKETLSRGPPGSCGSGGKSCNLIDIHAFAVGPSLNLQRSQSHGPPVSASRPSPTAMDGRKRSVVACIREERGP